MIGKWAMRFQHSMRLWRWEERKWKINCEKIFFLNVKEREIWRKTHHSPGEKSQDFHFVEYVEEYELRDFDQIAFEKKNSKRFYFFIGSFQKYAVATESIDSWFSLTKSFNKRWNISRINTAFISPLRIEWVWRFIYYERSRERVRGGEVDSGRELCMIEREGEKEQEREREQTSEERHKRGLTRKHIML